MAGQSLLDMLLGRGDAVGNLANVAANGLPAQQQARIPQPVQQVAAKEGVSFQEMMNQLTVARQRQKARQAAQALQVQGGNVLPQQY